MSETVIEHVLGRLKSIGIDHVFGVPGDYPFPVEDAIVNFPRMRQMGTHVFMALVRSVQPMGWGN